MTISQTARLIETFAPLALQEEWDNAGLCVGNAEQEVGGVMLCLDVTEGVVQEAIAQGCNLIVSHHPVIFKGLRQIAGQNAVQRIVEQAIKNNIALYAAHTNLDKVRGGVSEKMCDQLGLLSRQILCAPNAETGLGMMGCLPKALAVREFVAVVKRVFGARCLRCNSNYALPQIERVAVCGGSGASLMQSAYQQGAQAYISADFKYHDFQAANPDFLCIDIGHYESEIFALQIFLDILNKNTTFAVFISKEGKNSVGYL